MIPAARVAAAIDILDEILEGQPAEKALTNWGRRSRFAGAKDRAAIRDLVFDALRCRRSFAALGGSETGRGLMIGELRAANAALSEIFSGVGHAPAAISAAEQAACPSLLPAVNIYQYYHNAIQYQPKYAINIIKHTLHIIMPIITQYTHLPQYTTYP